MPYTALPDMRMPYDNDGTVVYIRTATTTNSFSEGPGAVVSGANLLTMQAMGSYPGNQSAGTYHKLYWFFPETREVTAVGWRFENNQTKTWVLEGSADTGNGSDGTWETASWPGGQVDQGGDPWWDVWRSLIRPVSFTGPKKVIRQRYGYGNSGGTPAGTCYGWHLYGEKAAGQTPDDVIYINHDDTPGVEYTAVEDFGNQPLATTVVRQFRVKNTSATKTANTINIQCNDSDFAISEDNVNWVTTINIASLSAGAESATLYVRCTTPAVGSSLGPRMVRIVTTVASYT